MRILGLDIGDARTGIAVGNTDSYTASAVCTLPAAEVASCAKSFMRILDDWKPELIVCGLPRSMDGSEGAQAARVRQSAEALSQKSGIDCVFFDERLSSVSAEKTLHRLGYHSMDMRGKTDMVAAAETLQAYLESIKPHS